MSEEEKINLPNTEPENPQQKNEDPPLTPSERHSAGRALTINPMEVHHHPHVEKKNFKEYFLEFIMIFLAVSLGFFAESLREYVSENKHAKEYAKSMISDLTSDTAYIKRYIAYTTIALDNTDTLSQLLSNNEVKQIPTGKLYWYGLWGGAHEDFVPHDATIHQMESSGELRYFTNPKLNRDVANYDQLCRNGKRARRPILGFTLK
ncbi:MAG TPA: hypothetical protein VMU83_12335 [Hanamia sp.]|nr:hypothetical protein [Hanamia sp.]